MNRHAEQSGHRGYVTWVVLFSVVGLGFVTGAEGIIIVDNGKDHFETQPGTTWDFSTAPIPADFFGPGSEPFEGQVALQGVPMAGQGTTDTIVERFGDPDFTPGPTATIPIEIVALNLISADPIPVGFNGGGTELWHVMIMLPSPGQTQSGQYELDQGSPPGGTLNFDSFFDVTYELEFQSAAGGPILTDQRGQHMAMQNAVPWSPTAPSRFDFGDSRGLFPGLNAHPEPETLLFGGSQFGWGVRLAVVPEPVTLVLMAGGIAGLLGRRR